MSVDSLFGVSLMGFKPEEATPIEATSEELASKLEAVAVAAREGLSLNDAAALHGIGHRRLSAFVRLGEGGSQPWARWLTGLCADAARARAETLKALAELADVDASAARDLRRLSGTETECARALGVLRRAEGAERGARAEKARFDETQRKREPQERAGR
jgi:hypothetical protein